MRVLRNNGVFEEFAQLRSQRKAQSDACLGADADRKARLLLVRFSQIEKRLSGWQLIFCLCVSLRAGSIQRKCKSVGLRGLVKRGCLFIRWFFDKFDRIGACGGREFPEHGCELEFREKLAAGFQIEWLRFHRGQIEIERHMAVDGD